MTDYAIELTTPPPQQANKFTAPGIVGMGACVSGALDTRVWCHRRDFSRVRAPFLELLSAGYHSVSTPRSPPMVGPQGFDCVHTQQSRAWIRTRNIGAF